MSGTTCLSPTNVKAGFGFQVSGMGIARMNEVPKKEVNARCLDMGLPPPGSCRRNPREAGTVVASEVALVLQVFAMADIPEVRYPVVAFDPVDVIDALLRPSAIDVQPRQAMRHVQMPIKTDPPVSAVKIRAGFQPGCSSIAAGLNPGEDPGVRIVVQQFAQARGGKIGSSHDAVPSQSGQRPGSVSSAVPASLF